MIRRIQALLVLLAIMIGGAAAPTADAQPPGRVGAAPAAAASEPAQGGFYAWVAARQGEYNKRLAAVIREIRTGDPLVATLLLAGLSFAYGILHASGPGHGKAIISSYALANERTVRRGIALSFLAALFQALSAIVLVGVLVLVLKATGATRKATEAWLETVSWGLVALLGAWLLWGQLRRLFTMRAAPAAGHDHGASHAHAEGHRHSHGLPVHAHAHAVHGHHHHGHDHHHHGHHDHGHGHQQHVHDHSECCGHTHMPDPSQLEGRWSWPRAIALALAVGMRPCTGAVFVLGFALSQGLFWAGVFATFAMALGTAITVSALAALAVSSRELAARLGRSGSGWGGHVRTAAGICGSLAVMAFGLVLFLGSLGQGSAL